jgi:hypothetical protein
MSAATADPIVVEETIVVEKESGFTRLRKKTGRALRATGRAIKNGAKALWHGTVIATVWTATKLWWLTVRTLALVGWILSAAVWIVMFAVVIAVGLIAAIVLALALGIAYPVSRGADWWNDNVITVPAYWLKKRYVSFREYKEHRGMRLNFNGIARVEGWFNRFTTTAEEPEHSKKSAWSRATETFSDTVHAFVPGRLKERAEEQAEADRLDAVAQFPGATITSDGEVHTEGSLWEAIEAFPGDAVDMDFSNWINDPVLKQAFIKLGTNAGTREERAYWTGRLTMLGVGADPPAVPRELR